MPQATERFQILLVDPGVELAANAKKLAHPEVEFVSLGHDAIAAAPIEGYDAIAVSIDAPATLDVLAELCGREEAPPVIAIAGKGWPGRPLEFVLTLAELRGAALGLPKPIDALELALAAAEVIERVRPQAARPKLVKQLRKLAG